MVVASSPRVWSVRFVVQGPRRSPHTPLGACLGGRCGTRAPQALLPHPTARVDESVGGLALRLPETSTRSWAGLGCAIKSSPVGLSGRVGCPTQDTQFKAANTAWWAFTLPCPTPRRPPPEGPRRLVLPAVASKMSRTSEGRGWGWPRASTPRCLPQQGCSCWCLKAWRTRRSFRQIRPPR